MSEKRRDNKNRILRMGEQQRADGRYLFSTIDPITKKRKFVYSWKLERYDKMPEGKKPDLSLREKEKLLERDLANSIRTGREIFGAKAQCQTYHSRWI